MEMMRAQATAADDLDVIAESTAWIVLNKPSGLLCVPGRGEDKQDCLSARAQRHWPDAQIVHRLDQPTSGLVLMARGAEAQRMLSKAFAARQVHKRYQALVEGHPLALPETADAQGWQCIHLPIRGDWERRPLQIVDYAHGKPSRSHWRILEQGAHAHGLWSRLELEPYTGRTHQLRVHLQAIGHPIWGDTLYAPPEVQRRRAHLCLHACTLGFADPVTGQWHVFNAPPSF